ncbi:hypothetical protein [Planomonospora venezuelensis]|uniref:Uncharacterized protein n=1 Tax=Planomonospora venezuelensis TaxID=1999 RepID=A0A841CYC3_PLAVE|nr:hypothetical protein [Planomonospora venezuelensis]MBB5960987.1 hypothetical protein [Planomonospora venezuelensis]GIN01221.1 hypothetical protein Pve01_28790 [Planomonospora venezuelensis]
MEQDDPERWRSLPERIAFDRMVTTQPVAPVRDPEVGRDIDHEFMIRYGAG